MKLLQYGTDSKFGSDFLDTEDADEDMLGELREKLSLSEAQLGRIQRVLTNLNKTIKNDVMESISLLEEVVGLDDKGLRTLIKSKPEVLGMNARYEVLPCIAGLQERLAYNTKEIGKIIKQCKDQKSFHFEDWIPGLNFFQKQLGLTDPQLRAMVLRNPPLLGYDISEIAKTLDKLQKRLDLKKPELKEIITAVPGIAAKSFENELEPKLNWLQEELDLTPEEVRAVILDLPDRLANSLELRYKPRLQALRMVGEDDLVLIYNSALRDRHFCESIGVPEDLLEDLVQAAKDAEKEKAKARQLELEEREKARRLEFDQVDL